MDSQFKIFLGVELDKKSKTSLNQEIEKLAQNDVKIKLQIDDSSFKKLGESIDNLTKQIKSLDKVADTGRRVAQGIKEADKSLTPFRDNIVKMTDEYKKGVLSAEEFVKKMSSVLNMTSNKPLSPFYANQLNEGELEEFLNLVKNVKSTVQSIEPIGKLVETKDISIIKNDMGELVKRVETYKSEFGQVQTITSLVDKETGNLVSTQQTLTNNSEKYDNSLQKQLTTLSSLRDTVNSINTHYINGIKSGVSVDSDLIKQANAIKSEFNAIDNLTQQGVIVDKSRIDSLKRLISEQQNVINAQKQQQAENEKEKKSLQDLSLWQEKAVFNLEKLKREYSSKGMGTSEIDKMIQSVKNLDTKSENLGYTQKQINEQYRQAKSVLSETSNSLRKLANEQRNTINAQKQQQSENEREKKSLQELTLWQEKTLFNLEKLRREYANQGMNTAEVDKMIGEVKNLNVNSENLGYAQKQLNEQYRQSKSTLAETSASLRELAKEQQKTINAQKQQQAENEKEKKSLQDLTIWQEKTVFNLEKLKREYASKNMSTSEVDRMIQSVKNLNVNSENLSYTQKQLNEQYRQSKSALTEASKGADSLATSFKNVISMATGFYGVQSIIMATRQAITSMVDEVTTLDTSMINLSRVTDESQESYNRFKDTMFEAVKTIGGSASELIDSASEFAKLGFDFKTAGELSLSASKYATAGEMSLAEATDSLSASYSVFGGQFDDVIGKMVGATEIIDLYNKIGNTMSISSKDVGIALQNSANSLSMANNSLSESVALISTANKTVQDSSKIGNALRTISMRLRGVTEDGEELDAKLGDTIADITKKYGKTVEIFDKGKQEFKSTYDIMLELSEVWDKLSDAERAMLSEDIAGKNRAEVFMAIMNNAEDLTYAMEMAKDSIGSVDEEVAVTMQTFEKRVEVMKNAWTSLADTTLDSGLVKGIVDVITKLIEVTEACGGLTTVVTALGVAIIGVKFDLFAGGITKLIPNIISLTTELSLATAGAVALKGVLAGGLVVGGIMLAGAGIKALADAVEDAKNKVVNLKAEISDLRTTTDSVKTLCDEFDKLSSKENLTEEETQKLVDVQNQLKELLPEVSGYYDAEGNFIVQSVDQVKEYIKTQEDLIAKKRELIALDQKNTIDKQVEDVIFTKEGVDNLNEYLRTYKELEEHQINLSKLDTKGMLNLGMTDKEINQFKSLHDVFGGVEKAQQHLEDQTKEYADSLGDLKQKISDIIVSSTAYGSATEEMQRKVRDNISKMDLGSLGADELKAEINKITSSTDVYVKDMIKMEEATQKLSKAQEQFTVIARSTQSAMADLSKETLENNFEEATNQLADLVSILEDLEAGNGITASSFKKLSSNFPELLAYMNNEVSLADAIKQKMGELEDAQDTAYHNMLLNSEEYYNENIKGNTEMCNNIASQVTNLFNNLGIAYQNDMSNWKSLAEGKASVETQLINGLNKAWESHFSNLFKQFNKMANVPIASPQFDEQGFRDSLNKNKGLGTVSNPIASKELEDKLVAQAKAQFDAEAKQYSQYQKQYSDAMKEVSNIFDFKTDTIDIKVGGTKASPKSSSAKKESEKYASYINSLYSDMIDSLTDSTSKLDRIISNTNNLMEQSQMVGNDGISSFANEIFNLRTQLEELSSYGNVDLTVRPQVDSSQLKASGWNVEDGSLASMLTQGDFVWQGGEEDGQYVYVHYTPVLPDGKVLNPTEMESYLRNTLDHSQKVLDSDNLGVVLKVENLKEMQQDVENFLNTGEISAQLRDFLEESEKWNDGLHQLQKDFYDNSVELNKEGVKALIEAGTIDANTEMALRYQLEDSYQEKIDTLKSASAQIISLRKKIVDELNGQGYSELKGIDLTGLSELQLNKILKDIEKQIYNADMSSNEKLKASLEYKRDLISDLGSSIIQANNQINELAQDVIDVKKQLMDLQEANLDRLFEIRSSALEREEKLLEIRKSLLIEDGDDYSKELKESDQILKLNQATLKNIVQQRKLCEEQIAEYRKLGYDDESEKIQGLIDKWIDYEEARISMIKQIAETQRQNAIGSAQNELEDISKAKDYIKDLLDLTIDMLKQETEAKKEILKEQYDSKKESLKNEYDAEKDALKKKLDLIKEEANARKELLDKQKDERDYADDVAEKQKEISDIQNKITELSLDDSTSSVKKRNELQAELEKARKELEDLQYNRSIELQKQAIDEELKAQEEKIEKELDNLEDKYNDEQKLYEKNYNEQLKIYEDYLKNQTQLKADASDLIEKREGEFYERLKAYAMDYTDTTQAEFEDCWNKAYESLERYGDKQLNVISIIETMTQRMIELNAEIDRLNQTTYKDFIVDNPFTSDDDYSFAGDVKNEDDVASNNLPTEKEAKEKAQLNQQQYLHEQMVQAKASKDTGLQNWIKSERSRWGLEPDTGKIIGDISESAWQEYKKKYNIQTRHTGIETGFVGGSPLLKSNEEFNKLLKGELVINAKQMDTFMNKHLPNFVAKAGESSSLNGSVVIDMHDFSVTQESLPKLQKFLKEQVPKIINDQLFSKGIK